MSVNFAKNQDEIIAAWRKVVDEKDKPNWALYGYEGNTNVIRLMSTGSGGLATLVQELNCSLIQYAFCRVIDVDNNVNKLILINWQGDSSPLSRKGLCASHVGDVANYFKGASQTITIRNDDEATVEYLMSNIIKSRPNRIDVCIEKKLFPTNETNSNLSSSNNPTSERQTNGSSSKDQIAQDRKTFWQIQEEEEKLRLIEEKKRAAEKQAQFEKERKLKEESEAKKLAETIKERDRLIEATRTAERCQSASSMNSIQSSRSSSFKNDINDEDDERVGRRSELIRLERNQETQSLISKGQIKNRRALFERASQQQAETSTNLSSSGTLSRRSSGSIVKKRLDAFQSLEQGKPVTNMVEKIVDRTNKMILNDETNLKSNVIVTQAIESVKLTNTETPTKTSKQASSVPSDEVKQTTTNGFQKSPSVAATNGMSKHNTEPLSHDNHEMKAEPANGIQKQPDQVEELKKNGKTMHESDLDETDARTNGDSHVNNDSYSHENNNHIPVTKTPEELLAFRKIVDAIMAGEEEADRVKPRAVAIYDYQAADKTEISFDPNDLIGVIEKVDVGWWHGTVLSGKYVGQRGLFPHNHVLEL